MVFDRSWEGPVFDGFFTSTGSPSGVQKKAHENNQCKKEKKINLKKDRNFLEKKNIQIFVQKKKVR